MCQPVFWVLSGIAFWSLILGLLAAKVLQLAETFVVRWKDRR